MKIIIYYDKNQQGFYEKLAAINEDMTLVQSEVELRKVYIEEECPILIIISQPQKNLLQKFESLHFSSIISFVGIRTMNQPLAPCLYFENEMDFKIKLNQCLSVQKKQIDSNYLSQFVDIDHEDIDYLSKLSGINLKENDKGKEYSKKNKNSVVLANRALITVLGNPELACYLAKTVAKKSRGKVLIIDGDLMKPSMDRYFNISNLQTTIKSHLVGIDNTGINIALDTLAKGLDLEQGINAFTKYAGKNMRVMLGNYNLYNYEHYDEKQIKFLISKLQNYFQTIILHVSDQPYDSCTMMGLHLSDINIFTCPNSISEIRYNYNLFNVLHAKQGLSTDKNILITYDYTGLENKASRSVIRSLFGKNYFGHHSKKLGKRSNFAEKIVERMMLWD